MSWQTVALIIGGGIIGLYLLWFLIVAVFVRSIFKDDRW